MSREFKILAILSTLAVGGIVLFLALVCVLWTGGYTLEVHLQPTGDAPVRIGLYSTWTFAEAESIAKIVRDQQISEYGEVAVPFTGTAFYIHIPLGGEDSVLGIEISRDQHRGLIVIATMPNGEIVVKVVEIPDSRTSKMVTIVFP